MTLKVPAFLPMFGTGAPGANVPWTNLYFDTATTPVTAYVRNGAAGWKKTGSLAGGVNVTSIQGVPVSATAPTLNQKLEYDGTQWAPHT